MEQPLPEELNELRIHPIGTEMKGVDIEKRKIIAAKIEFITMEVDDTLTPPFRDIYIHFPRWKFYTDKKTSTQVLRVYAIALNSKTGAVGLHIAQCKCSQTLDFSLRPSETIVAINFWSREQLKIIQQCKNPGLFKDPCAWLHIAELGRKHVPK